MKKPSTLKFIMNISFLPSVCIHRSIILIFIEKKVSSAIFDFHFHENPRFHDEFQALYRMNEGEEEPVHNFFSLHTTFPFNMGCYHTNMAKTMTTNLGLLGLLRLLGLLGLLGLQSLLSLSFCLLCCSFGFLLSFR